MLSQVALQKKINCMALLTKFLVCSGGDKRTGHEGPGQRMATGLGGYAGASLYHPLSPGVGYARRCSLWEGPEGGQPCNAAPPREPP